MIKNSTFFSILFLLFTMSLSCILCGCGASEGDIPVRSSGQIVSKHGSDIHTGMGLQCVPSALYSSDEASSIVIGGDGFGSSSGKVLIVSGNVSSELVIARWSDGEIVVTVNPKQLAAGGYSLKILAADGSAVQTQEFTILEDGRPLISSFKFESFPTLGKKLPSITFYGRNLLPGGVMPKIYALSEGGQPVELAIASAQQGTADTVVTSECPSFLFKGSKVSFYAVTSAASNNVTVVPPSVGKIYALFVGVDDYKYINKLVFAGNDAVYMSEALRSGDRNSLWNNSENIIIVNSDATKKNILDRIEGIAETMTSEDVFFMYYAGHGSSANSANPQPDTETYICPVDAKDNVSTMISSAELKSYLLAMPKNSYKMLIFDCCFSGGFIGKGAVPETARYFPLTDAPKDLAGGGFRNIGSSVKNMMFATSSSYNELSTEEASLGGGMYTFCLRQALGIGGNILGSGAAGGESIINFTEMYSVSNAICTGLSLMNKKQNPQIYTSPDGINFPIKGNL